MQTYGVIDQKCNATLSVYVHNFQMVTSKLLETKLEVNETLKDINENAETEQAKTSILQLQSRTSEQILTDDSLKSSFAKKAPEDSATLKLHEYEPCAPLSNFPEEKCGEVQQFFVNKVILGPLTNS